MIKLVFTVSLRYTDVKMENTFACLCVAVKDIHLHLNWVKCLIAE